MRKLITETYGLFCILAELCKVAIKMCIVFGFIGIVILVVAYLMKQIF